MTRRPKPTELQITNSERTDVCTGTTVGYTFEVLPYPGTAGAEIPWSLHMTCSRCGTSWDVPVTLIADGHGTATAKGPIVARCPNGCGADD